MPAYISPLLRWDSDKVEKLRKFRGRVRFGELFSKSHTGLSPNMYLTEPKRSDFSTRGKTRIVLFSLKSRYSLVGGPSSWLDVSRSAAVVSIS